VASTSSRRLTLVGALTAVLGLAALFWQLRGVNPHDIWEGIYRVRWGFPVILALGGLRFALRAYAWTRCVEPPARLAPGDAFAAVLAGDAVGNLTPLGPIVSEPAKAAFVRGRVDLGAAIAALAIENLYYTLSVAAMIAAGTIALLFSFDVGPDVRYTSEAALAIIFAMFAIVAVVLWRRPAVISRALGIFARSGAALAPPERLDRVRRLEDEIYSFGSRRRAVLARVVAAEIAFHALGVVEICLTVWLLLGGTPSLLHAFVLEGANRLITVVFKFVPLRVGGDEAGTEWLTQVLGYGPGLGVTLALVRKVRMIAWSVAGSALLVHRGLSARRILDDSQLARARDI
jgi:hypothetical protein